jgi:hypothetical protein
LIAPHGLDVAEHHFLGTAVIVRRQHEVVRSRSEVDPDGIDAFLTMD